MPRTSLAKSCARKLANGGATRTNSFRRSDALLTLHAMDQRILTLGHSPDPDDAFMFYALAKELIPTHGFRFEHILQDIQTLNERATRGELDISAISIHAFAYVSQQYALLPSGASRKGSASSVPSTVVFRNGSAMATADFGRSVTSSKARQFSRSVTSPSAPPSM